LRKNAHLSRNEWISGSADETFQIGKAWGATLKSGAVIAFSGDLGAGKTTFIRGIADSFAIDTHSVSSPTFTYLNVYSGSKTLFHFDLYRIKDAKAFLAAGFDDFLQEDAICCIEWAERIDTLLKESIYRVSINIVSEEEREICIRS
jgi:tRNA threonylcarbamoyladenosine biosynthesis protein TsaE